VCLEHHPDKKLVGVDDPADKERIEDYFKQIQEAYEVRQGCGGSGGGGGGGGGEAQWHTSGGMARCGPDMCLVVLFALLLPLVGPRCACTCQGGGGVLGGRLSAHVRGHGKRHDEVRPWHAFGCALPCCCCHLVGPWRC
jgi:hypothetical protein